MRPSAPGVCHLGVPLRGVWGPPALWPVSAPPPRLSVSRRVDRWHILQPLTVVDPMPRAWPVCAHARVDISLLSACARGRGCRARGDCVGDVTRTRQVPSSLLHRVAFEGSLSHDVPSSHCPRSRPRPS